MKHILLTSLLSALLFASCQHNDPVVKSSEVGYIRMAFNYKDGTSEYSRIVDIEKNSSLRTNLENRTISGVVTLPDGEYGVITMEEGSWLKVEGKVTIQNLNTNKPCVINIYKTADFELKGSLNLNGGITFVNESPNFKIGNAIELQNSKSQSTGNSFESYYSFSCQEMQINDPYSIFILRGCGTVMTVSNAVNFNGNAEDKFVLVEGASLVTGILNVNNKNVFSGEGLVKVLNNVNLNNNLTTSSKIKFCYVDGSGNPRSLNNPEKLGSAVRSCETGCKPLAVHIESISAKSAGENSVFVSFKVTENTNLSSWTVEFSKGAKSWKKVYSGSASELNVGKVFSKEVNF